MAKNCNKIKLQEPYKHKHEHTGKFNFKLQYPTVITSEDHLEKIFKERSLALNQSTDYRKLQPLLKKETLRFKCNFEEKRRKAEIRRKKIIQRLKRVYRINVENLGENAADDIIRKVNVLEKREREKEKRTTENTINMVMRLLAEQKYKRRGTSATIGKQRKKPKIIPRTKVSSASLRDWWKLEEEPTTKEEKLVDMSDALNQKGICTEKQLDLDQTLTLPFSPKQTLNKGKSEKKMSQIKEKEQEAEYEEGIFNDAEPKIDTAKPCLWPRSEKPIPVEKNLISDPKSVIFQDYKKGKIYLKTIRITNIGKETIHCRYLGILVHIKAEDHFPIGVAVRDNVKLKPGFSCSTKIRLCTQNDVEEQECSIIYETRRQSKPLQHSCFFVPVKCIPDKVIIKVSPLKIRFPSLTWCATNEPESSKLFKKIIKIENMGGKCCSCKIVKKIIKREEKEMSREEREWTFQTSSSSITEVPGKDLATSYYYYYGEGSLYYEQSEANLIENIMDELFENVFKVFRFSKKYHIEVGPFSAVEIEVKFAPQYQGFHLEKHVIEFQDCYSPIQEIIELTGDVKKLPLRAKPEVVDLKICVANSGVYAATFKVFNCGKAPYSVSLKIPPAMKKHASIYPRSTIIQAMSHYDFSVKFFPRLTIVEDAGEYFNKASAVVEFPVFIHPANADSCKSDFIQIHVFALITDYALELSPPTIDFGTVSTLETFRTQISLTNHSLVPHAYGFLNLPKGVLVEPNMGFGRILPKESIPLYILYSPGADLTRGSSDKMNTHTFEIKVTSKAECGGLGEKLPEEKKKPAKDFWKDDYDDDYSETNDENVLYGEDEIPTATEGKQFNNCEETDFALEGEDSNEKLQKLEEEIRNFLRKDGSLISEHPLPNEFNLTKQEEDLRNSKYGGGDFKETERTELKGGSEGDVVAEEEEEEEEEEDVEQADEEEPLRNIFNVIKQKKNRITCRALVMEPYCQLSKTVIQLPATPYSSVSLYRFHLNAFNESLDNNCSCGTHMAKSSKPCTKQPKFEGAFEFQYSSPHIKLEPQSGYLKAGQSIPINIIYTPKLPAEKIRKEKQIQATAREKSMELKGSFANSASKPQTKTQKISLQNLKTKSDVKSNKDVTNTSIQPQQKYDLLASGDRTLTRLIDPFCVQIKINCIVKIVRKSNKSERTECHDMILVCPCIKPSFAYLGNGREINFDQVLVGRRSRILIEAQNVSLKRIAPTISLFNPVGSFSCATSLKRLEVDPEHVWYYPLVYAPTEVKGVEKEFFEIQFESTNVFLMAKGEAIEPQCKITPTMACYLLECKPGNYEEIKIEIENLNPVNLPVQFVTEFIKEGYEGETEKGKDSESEAVIKERSSLGQNEARRRKTTNSEWKKISYWEEVPQEILLMIEAFHDLEDSNRNFFGVIGTDIKANHKLEVPALGKSTARIRFSPIFLFERDSSLIKNQAAKFKIMLEGSSKVFKEITIIGAISKF